MIGRAVWLVPTSESPAPDPCSEITDVCYVFQLRNLEATQGIAYGVTDIASQPAIGQTALGTTSPRISILSESF